MSKQRNRQ